MPFFFTPDVCNVLGGKEGIFCPAVALPFPQEVVWCVGKSSALLRKDRKALKTKE